MSNEIAREVRSVALAICDGFSGPFSDLARKCIEEERWDDLVSIKIDPHMFKTHHEYFSAAVCTSFLRKYEPLPTTFDRKQVAIDGFWEAERTCYRTNQRLLPFIYNTLGSEDEALRTFFVQLRKEVIGLIGERPPANPAGRFGPGTTYGDRGGLATIPDKMSSSPTMTRDAWPFLIPWSGTLWGKAVSSRSGSPSIIRGNRFTTANKDCTKHRGICIGASINSFYQLGFGSAMREGLKRAGIDLRVAQNIHRQVARGASISGKFATLDLRQASDTQASALVRLALPPKWYEPLFDLREPITEINDGVAKSVVLEKFSAMGNGYTFELETCLFLAICRAVYVMNGVTPVNGENVWAYGDDLIVLTELEKEVKAALRFCGLEINETKSFVSGPFRESCGGDYFEGVDVRPFFLKKEPSEPQDWIAMANGIRSMVPSQGLGECARGLGLRHAWFLALDNLPSQIRRCRGPSGLGDIVIHDEAQFWNTRTESSIRYVRCYRPAQFKTVSWNHFDNDVILAGACYGVPWNDGGVTPRDAVLGHAVSWVPYS